MNNLFTAGELAKMAGVSLRTIRFYDSKGLLCPVSYSESGYRLYNRDSLVCLQHILMLKFLGFSLQQIADILKDDSDMDTHLSHQKDLLQKKKLQLEQMISTIEVVKNSKEEEKWDALIHLLNIMTEDEKIIEQYRQGSNLEKRINLHSYSTSSENWYDWVYERLGVSEGQSILEIGCGNAKLWAHNAEKLPHNLKITLTDRSEHMLAGARATMEPFGKLLQTRKISIQYQVADANKLKLLPETYHLIVANHVLYHVSELDACLRAISKALRFDGIFCCSTIGMNHMQELHEMVAEFDANIEIPSNNHVTMFRLENSLEKLKQYFETVQREIQDNDLVVDNADAIYNYVSSYPGNAPYILSCREKEFRQIIQEKIDKNGAIYIHKAAGMFICEKQISDK